MTTITTDAPTIPTYTDPYPGRKGKERISFECGCDNGVYTGPSRIVWNNGRGETKWCFDCNGSGTYTVLVSSLRAAARRRVNAEVARIEAVAAGDGNELAWSGANEELANQLAELEGFAEEFGSSLRGAIRRNGSLSEKQEAALVKAVADHRARQAARAAATPVVEGRGLVTGTVVSVKAKDGYRPGSIALKLTVADERGFRVYGTLPNALYGVEKGDAVSFTATLTRSADDELFGFFSRPRVAA